MIRVETVAQFLREFAPPRLAASWDNTGLLLGDPAAEVTTLMTCLTLTPEVSREAVDAGARLVVAHHPVLFKGAKSLTAATAEGRTLLPLLRAGVAVYSPHTAFDNCEGGINDDLVTRAGLTGVKPLRVKPAAGKAVKLVAFTPPAAADAVSAALFAAGAGRIGAYSECSFRSAGTGTFYGSDSTNPAVGERGRREQVEELRLEVVVPVARLAAAVTALRAAHPYEEPAFDVYPLHAPPGTGGEEGEGRVGELPTPEPLAAFAARLGRALGAGAVQTVGDPARLVARVAFACGAAGEYLADAAAAGADVFVTGEMRYHDLLAAEDAGVALVLPGHYATERSAVERLAERLAAAFPSLGVFASRRERDPLRWAAVNPS